MIVRDSLTVTSQVLRDINLFVSLLYMRVFGQERFYQEILNNRDFKPAVAQKRSFYLALSHAVEKSKGRKLERHLNRQIRRKIRAADKSIKFSKAWKILPPRCKLKYAIAGALIVTSSLLCFPILCVTIPLFKRKVVERARYEQVYPTMVSIR